MPETTPPAKKTAAAKPGPGAATAPPASLAEALVAFMLEKPKVAKSQTATIPGREGRTGYSYKYADLADVDDAATPILAKYGLAFVAIPRRTDNGAYELVGTIIHTSGEKLEGPLPLSGRTAQELGSSLTYMRRYLLGSMTGIVTDEDDDGSRAETARQQAGNQAAPEDQTPEPMTQHAEATFARLRDLTEAERHVFGPWWEREAGQGNLPLRANIRAITPAQATWVAEVIDNMRKRAAEEAASAAQAAQPQDVGGEGSPDPQ